MGIETVAIGAMIAGTVASAGGAYLQAQQNSAMAKYNAKVAYNNARAAREQADYREQRTREQQRYRQGKMITAYLKSGVQIDPGDSSSLVLEEQARQNELDALMVRYTGQIESGRYLSDARLERFKSSAYTKAGTIKAGATILTGAGESYMAGTELGVF